MKFLQAAALLAVASAVEIGEAEMNEIPMDVAEVEMEESEAKPQQDTHLAQLVIQAIKGTDPRVIPKPRGLSKTDGSLIGTRTTTSNLGYTYHWQWVCEYMTWTPTNQFLHAKKKYSAKTMTLERFGFIGEDKKCYWGMVSVMWVTPLKVVQIKP